jgi:hypothetical protein
MIGNFININDDWRIAIEDRLNFVLERKVVSRKTGVERWKVEGYYQDLDVLCLDLRDNMVRDYELENSINSLIKAVKKSTNEIRVALGESPLLDGVKD